MIWDDGQETNRSWAAVYVLGYKINMVHDKVSLTGLWWVI